MLSPSPSANEDVIDKLPTLADGYKYLMGNSLFFFSHALLLF
jgi:hypothetical protein